MKDIIEIEIPAEEIAKREERIRKAKHFEKPDRVPVVPAIAHRLLVPQVGVRFRDYYRDPETMLRTQILAQKWLMENIRTDAYSITGAWVGAWTDFQNTFEAGSLGCEIVFPDDDIPWVGPAWVKNDDDLRRLEDMDFIHSGLNARQVEYRNAMMAVAEKYPVRFQGGEIFYPGENPSLTHTSDGPFGVAGDLMGVTEIFTAVYERPEFVRELLRIVTDKLIEYLDFCWEEENLPTPKDFAWTDDLAVSLSEETYRELVLPFEKKLRFHFDGYLSLHMCGKSDHLLKTFAEDLQINELQGFGYQVDLDTIAEVMGGRVVLIGNVNPMLIHSGTPEEVRQACRVVIEKLGPYGGLILQDGNNIPPGTPVENINAMMEAAEQYGRYD
ncbi:MAG: uroporphyrinogen decarboxylase family protein [Calditrichia bacterium]